MKIICCTETTTKYELAYDEHEEAVRLSVNGEPLISFDAIEVFDLLQAHMDMGSPNPGISRRAKTLNRRDLRQHSPLPLSPP